MARPVEESIGATDATRPPSRVRQRVFDREGGKCHLCKQIIQAPGQKWDLDHVTAIINGGENREKNLKPAHRKCHKDKTAADVAEKAKVAAIRGKHIGAIRPKQTISSRGFDRKQRSPKPSLSPKPMFQPKEANRNA